MSKAIRGFFLFLFSALFGLLISGLFAQAHSSQPLRVQTTSPHYPVETLDRHPRLDVEKERPAPWWVEKRDQTDRIFTAAGIEKATGDWDALEKSLFIQRLDLHGAKGVADRYKQFSAKQLKAAEKELKRIRDGI